ncbi:hypothetical protein M405DRAFT_831221 [Rhizopogon salebrosus TDB-379]|nr:hypothetical protein M405DRAFT_831221 [Rhizopogon salebrosus TDB-379]
MLGYDMNRAGIRDCYHENPEKPSSYDIQIDLDVPRTISGHIMLRTRYGLGQRSLFHVLHSLSGYDAYNMAMCRAWAL